MRDTALGCFNAFKKRLPALNFDPEVTHIEKFAFMSTITSLVVETTGSVDDDGVGVDVIDGGIGETFLSLKFSTLRTTGQQSHSQLTMTATF